MKYSMIATLRPFTEACAHSARQHSAVFSWSLVEGIETKIVGVDDDEGLRLTEKYGFGHVSDVMRAYDVGYFSKAPIINDMLAKGLEATTGEWLILINSDIIVLPDFPEQLDAALERIESDSHQSCFITVRRRDFTFQEQLLTPEAILTLKTANSRLHGLTGSDIFIAPRAFWQQMLDVIPPYIYGRFSWDVYLHGYALKHATPAVDASETILCYHPYHGSLVNQSDPEVYHNLTMFESLMTDTHVPKPLSQPGWLRI